MQKVMFILLNINLIYTCISMVIQMIWLAKEMNKIYNKFAIVSQLYGCINKQGLNRLLELCLVYRNGSQYFYRLPLGSFLYICKVPVNNSNAKEIIPIFIIIY